MPLAQPPTPSQAAHHMAPRVTSEGSYLQPASHPDGTVNTSLDVFLLLIRDHLLDDHVRETAKDLARWGKKV